MQNQGIDIRLCMNFEKCIYQNCKQENKSPTTSYFLRISRRLKRAPALFTRARLHL